MIPSRFQGLLRSMSHNLLSWTGGFFLYLELQGVVYSFIESDKLRYDFSYFFRLGNFYACFVSSIVRVAPVVLGSIKDQKNKITNVETIQYRD
jgi:hypothetical protein